jgi:hypothetical protein
VHAVLPKNGDLEGLPIRGHTPEPPYCWQNKEAKRLIRHQLDGDPLQKIALAVYDALTEIASNESSPTFMTSQPFIGSLAGGYEVRSLQRVLPILRELKLIYYITPTGKLRGPITYSLLTLASPSRFNATACRNDTTGGDSKIESQRRINKETKQRKTDTSDEDFELFWKAYPKKTHKAEAAKAWEESSESRPSTGDLLKSLEAFRKDDWSGGNRYIPSPVKWITEARWEEHLPKPKKSSHKIDVVLEEEAFDWRAEHYPASLDPDRHPTWKTFPTKNWPPHMRDEFSREHP